MGKARLKHAVLRYPPFSTHALQLCARNDADQSGGAFPRQARFAAADQAPPVRWVFEDASVRMAAPGAAAQRSRAALVDAFLAPVLHTLRAHAEVHTYVMCFDKPAYVPTRKQPLQRARDAALRAGAAATAAAVATAAAANNNDDDDDDDDGPQHACTLAWLAAGDAATNVPLPDWRWLRARRALYARGIDRLARDLAVAAAARLPPGRRLVIDWQRDGGGGGGAPATLAPLVVRGGDGGHYDETLRNAHGEADVCAQHYADAATRRGDSIVLRTVDTDYVAIAMLHHEQRACTRARAPELAAPAALGNVYVALGTAAVRRDDGSYCTHAHECALLCHELYDVRALCRVVRRAYAAPPACFAAFCVASGNDYVTAPRGGHRRLFAAWCALHQRRVGALLADAAHRDGDGRCMTLHRRWHVLPGALAAWLRAAAGGRRRGGGRAPPLSAFGLRPSPRAYYESVVWALEYAAPRR